MVVSYQRRNSPLKWIQGFCPRAYSYFLERGDQGQIGSIVPIHRVRLRSAVPHPSVDQRIAEVDRTNGVTSTSRKSPQEKNSVRDVVRKTVAPSTTRLVRMGEFEVVNDIGFEPPVFVDQNA